MSHLRIQAADATDLVRIDLQTGDVEVLKPEQIGDAARAFWDAVQTAWLAIHQQDGITLFGDFIFRSGEGDRPGDISFISGAGAGPCPGGNVKIHAIEDAASADPGTKTSITGP